ncbi:hypothetical protein [Streptomyces sp. NPDC101455]
MTSIPQEPSGESNPLRALTLDRLRRRTSMKWRESFWSGGVAVAVGVLR